MPTPCTKSAAEYRERAKKLRLAAETVLLAETRDQLLVIASDYENLAEDFPMIDPQPAID